MTIHKRFFWQRRIAAPVMTVAAIFALSACSSSDQGATQASTTLPTASAASQGDGSVTPAAAKARFAAYTSPIPASPSNAQCALDAVNDKSAADAAPLPAGSDVVFSGWAGNGSGQAANGFLLVLQGAQSYSAPIVTDVARADVAKALSSDGMANSGFGLTASLAGVPAGSYSIYFAAPQNPSNVCAANRTVVVQ